MKQQSSSSLKSVNRSSSRTEGKKKRRHLDSYKDLYLVKKSYSPAQTVTLSNKSHNTSNVSNGDSGNLIKYP